MRYGSNWVAVGALAWTVGCGEAGGPAAEDVSTGDALELEGDGVEGDIEAPEEVGVGDIFSPDIEDGSAPSETDGVEGDGDEGDTGEGDGEEPSWWDLADGCQNPLVVPQPSLGFETDLCEYTSQFSMGEGVGCRPKPEGGRDFVIQFIAPKTGEFALRANSTVDGDIGYDLDVNIIASESCPEGPIAQCESSSSHPARPISTAFLSAVEGQSYWAVVSAAKNVDCGAVRFSISEVQDERCDDGVDNDFNGLTDCMDPACQQHPACVDGAPGSSCQQPFERAGWPLRITGDSCLGGTSLPIPVTGNDCYRRQEGSPEFVVAFVAPVTGRYRVHAATRIHGHLGYDAVLNVIEAQEACPVEEITACVASSDAALTADEALVFVAEAGQRFWVVAGAFGGSQCGPVEILIHHIP